MRTASSHGLVGVAARRPRSGSGGPRSVRLSARSRRAALVVERFDCQPDRRVEVLRPDRLSKSGDLEVVHHARAASRRRA